MFMFHVRVCVLVFGTDDDDDDDDEFTSLLFIRNNHQSVSQGGKPND